MEKYSMKRKENSRNLFKVILFMPLSILSLSCGFREYVYTWTTSREECDGNGENCVTVYDDHSECRNCVAPCYECSSALDCANCFPGSGRYLHLQRCIVECPIYFWERNNTGGYPYRCTACHPTCQDCWNTGEYDCVKCLTGFILTHNGNCVTKCQDGEFSSSYTNYQCQKCHQACKTCFSGTKYSCLTCKPETPYYLPDKSCDIKCKYDQFISDRVAKICSTCHPDCETCYGAFKTECHRCKNGYVMDINLECIPECKIGTYLFNETHCAPCVSGCAECLGPGYNNCTSCMPDTKMHIDMIYKENNLILSPGQDPETASKIGESTRIDYHKLCYPICKVGFYEIPGIGANGDGECHRCHGLCRGCEGPLATECLNCVGNMTFLPGNQSCTCTEGYFIPGNIKEERGGYCEKCFSSCLLCNNPEENQCFKCKQSYYLKEGRCINDCGIGFYKEGLSEGKTQTGFERCLPCNPVCLNCNGPEVEDCLDCHAPYYKIKPFVLGETIGQCFNCFERFDEESANFLCKEIRYLKAKVEEKSRDGYSSKSLYLTYEDEFFFKNKLEKLNHNLTDYFKVISSLILNLKARIF